MWIKCKYLSWCNGNKTHYKNIYNDLVDIQYKLINYKIHEIINYNNINKICNYYLICG